MTATNTTAKTSSPQKFMSDAVLAKAGTCAEIGDVSVSWWHAAVADGRAPAPVVRQPRFTRWRLSDVFEFYSRIAAEPQEKGAAVLAQAVKASRAAQAKRKLQNASVAAEEARTA